MLKPFIRTLATAALTICVALPAAAADYTMRLSHGDNENNPTHKGALRFQELVEKYSDGRIEVQIFPSNQLGSEQEVAQALRMGSIESEILYTGNLVPLAPSVGVMMLPYAFTSNEEAHAAMDALKGPLNERLPKEAGVRVLGYFEKGFR
ncbi:TRAP transporter substrate-binding protein DctP, partial [Rhodovulum sulfidophilum]|nr:TRAP transporter substrate-binding protein DctP [Rhodovulum sulfidophilum]